MSKQFTIGQLAHAADIPTTTFRHYERVGLVEPEERIEGIYRLAAHGRFSMWSNDLIDMPCGKAGIRKD